MAWYRPRFWHVDIFDYDADDHMVVLHGRILQYTVEAPVESAD